MPLATPPHISCVIWLQDDLFRQVNDEIQWQHDHLTTVFKCAHCHAAGLHALIKRCLQLELRSNRVPPCSDAMRRHREQQELQGEDADAAPASVLWHGSEAEAAEVMVYHTAILRNKRLLMAYT